MWVKNCKYLISLIAVTFQTLSALVVRELRANRSETASPLVKLDIFSSRLNLKPKQKCVEILVSDALHQASRMHI
jgi:hypothetical protein